MTQRFFHASTKTYKAGEKVSAQGKASAEPWLKQFGKWEMEDEFEKLKPAEKVSRIGSLYACDSLENSFVYAKYEPWFAQAKFYEVTPNTTSTKVPMALVNRVYRLLQTSPKDLELVGVVVNEYWKPTQRWLYWEYLCEEMTVVDEVPPPTFQEGDPNNKAYVSFMMFTTTEQETASKLLSSRPKR